MFNKLLLCLIFSLLATVVVSKNSCWGQTSTSDIQKLFHYCKNVVPSNSLLEDKVKTFDIRQSPEKLCEDIKNDLNERTINGNEIGIFNKCMSLKTTRLGFWQLQKLYDCSSKLPDLTLIKDVLEVTKNHIGDGKIYRSIGELVDQRKTQDNRKAINDFYDCLGYIEDVHLEYPTRT